MVVDFPERVVHGGIGKQQREKTRKKLLDFSASVNPLPPSFAWSCDPSCLSQYPDNDYTLLKEIIARTFHRKPTEVCVGNGSMELIRVFCSVMLDGAKKYCTESLTFGEYSLSARLTGATAAASCSGVDVSFICNPNNPTGMLRKRDDVLSHVKEMASHGGTVFVDEAFIELADPSQSLTDRHDRNLFVLRSLTKSFAVPGIRFGYGFGNPDIIDKMEVVRPPWSVNAYAEAFASEAFRHMDMLESSREFIRKEREWLGSGISSCGLYCYPSSANYLLVEYGQDVVPLCAKLERSGILVRDCTSFGLPTCIRVAVRTHGENKALVEALSACVH
jgi:threonine-phosphate decarboxylase